MSDIIAKDLLTKVKLWILRKIFCRSYPKFYRKLMQVRVQQDPKNAVGGLWEEIGQLQFETLRKEGLRPDHILLDIGCGSLRGGRHFIDFLQVGHYTGIDISDQIIEAGKKLLTVNVLEEKLPKLFRNENLCFQEFSPNSFDFILAQSVFTHLPRKDVKECLLAIPRILKPGGCFYFTTFEAETEHYVSGLENFYYPRTQIEELCGLARLDLQIVEGFIHPRGQVMFKATPGCEQVKSVT